jgi:ATP-dependent Lhr-like helicase
VADPVGDLVLRYARTHGPFPTEAVAARLALPPRAVAGSLAQLAARGRVVQGAFTPGRIGREWCETDVLRQIRQRSLAKLRHEVEPVTAAALGRLATTWHGLAIRRSGLDALLDVIEQLQGAPLPASLLEREILPSRLDGYRPGDLDVLTSAGEITWVGVEPLGDRDGRIAVYLADHLARLLPPPAAPGELDDRATRIVQHLRREGASFFAAVHQAAGGGYPRETVDTLWDLVWRGLVTNDTFHPLRAFTQPTTRQPGSSMPRCYGPSPRMGFPFSWPARTPWSGMPGLHAARRISISSSCRPTGPGWSARWGSAASGRN